MNSLEKLFLFEGLTETEKKKILNSFEKPVAFKKGDVIYSAESFPNAIGFVVSGKAFAVTNNSHSLHMNSFENGACFGAAAIFGGDKYVSTIVAETDIEVLFITENELKKIFINYPVTSINYITFLSERVRFLNKKLGLIASGSAEDTVFKYLSSSANSENYARIPKSMTLLAKMLGIGRATLYRCLDTLEQNGSILRENNKIKVIKNEKNS